jgi:hypothetical protein
MNVRLNSAGSVTVPIGGVHPDVLEGNQTSKGGYTRVTVESFGVVPGPPFNLPSNWKKQVAQPHTLQQVRNCELSGGDERVISHKVGGLWVVGPNNLERDDVDAILEGRGLRFLQEEKFDNGNVAYLVEIYRPKGCPVDSSEATMSDRNIFGDIEVEAMHPPINGVPSAAFGGVSWGTKELSEIGLPSPYGRRGWMDDLRHSVSLAEIRDRTERPQTEHLVSQEIEGVLSTGVDALDHAALVLELENQGYTLTSSDTLMATKATAVFLVERFDRRD